MYFQFNTYGEVLARLDQLPTRLHAALEAKMHEVVDEAYDKVIENLSGRVLNQKTGALAESIRKGVERQGSLLVGWVAPEPESEKARALEEGGKGYYPIVPTKANLLSFYWELLGKRVALRYVNHPPSQAYHYLGSALAEVVAKADAEFGAMIDGVLK